MAVGIASLVLGAVQTGVSLYKLSQQGDAPKNEITPELLNAQKRAETMALSGYTPQETAAFKSNLATAGNTAYRRGVDMGGGNLAAALKAGINSQQLGALNQFAASDAALKRQNIHYADSVAQMIQSQKNQQTSQELAQYNQRQAAYGQAVQSGLNNIVSTANLNQALNYNPNGSNTGNYGTLSSVNGNNNPNAYQQNFINSYTNQYNPNQNYVQPQEYQNPNWSIYQPLK